MEMTNAQRLILSYGEMMTMLDPATPDVTVAFHKQLLNAAASLTEMRELDREVWQA